jgi:SpoVK/Ycf46/Vps4 family AAA+-type ATPase
VIIKNLLGSLVGLSDSNQERILSLLKAMAPILVIVDEGDVFFGKRRSEGDSGVQSRQFGRYATFMSDPANLGRVFWLINSAHPGNLADDFKRPGRCDIIIPLFPLTDPADQQEAFEKTFSRNGVTCGAVDWQHLLAELNTPGADGFPLREFTVSDIAKIANQAEELTQDRGSSAVEAEDIRKAIATYSSGSIVLIKKYQRLLAITEGTVPEAVPKPYCDIPMPEVYRMLRELKYQLGECV